jgi:hypothetical protein
VRSIVVASSIASTGGVPRPIHPGAPSLNNSASTASGLARFCPFGVEMTLLGTTGVVSVAATKKFCDAYSIRSATACLQPLTKSCCTNPFASAATSTRSRSVSHSDADVTPGPVMAALT